MPYYDDAPAYLMDYINYLSVIKTRSPLTIKNYYTDIRMFLRFLKLRKNTVKDTTEFSEISISDFPESVLKQVTLYDIMDFLRFTSTEMDNHSKARSRKSVSIRQFFKYLTDNKQWFTVSPAAKLEMPTPKRALPKHLTVEQASKLLDENSELSSWSDARDYCILTFFLNCGMRLSELVGINVTDYTETTDTRSGDTYSYLKVTGKGSKERVIYLNSSCVNAYKTYLKLRPEVDKKEKALFLSKQYKRISNRRVEQIIDEMLIKSGLDGQGFSVHKLRHTAATLMYQNGVDVRVLKEVLGHENLDTTQIYTHVSDLQIKQAMDQNPLDGVSAPRSKKKKTEE